MLGPLGPNSGPFAAENETTNSSTPVIATVSSGRSVPRNHFPMSSLRCLALSTTPRLPSVEDEEPPPGQVALSGLWLANALVMYSRYGEAPSEPILLAIERR